MDTFQKGAVPDEIETFSPSGKISIVDLLLASQLAKSKSEARRLVEQKGVKFEGAVIEDPGFKITKTGVLQVGKRHFLRIEL